MPNFKLVFITESIEKIWDKRTAREGREFSRIISAPDKWIVKKIASAMLGEEVFTLPLPLPSPLYLSQVLSVEKTNLKPQLNVFYDLYPWERVLRRLQLISDRKISGQKTFDGFKYFSLTGSGRKVRVGLKLNRAQRERLLAINL